MKVETYILNTMPSNHRWHNLAMSSFYEYFSRFDVKINVLDDRHHLVRQMIKHEEFNPLLRKAIRWYDFLDSGSDYGLFLDLDTVILSKDKDVRDRCDGKNYIAYHNLFKDGDIIEKFKHRVGDYWLLSRKFILDEFWKRNPVDRDCLKFNTGFSLLSRSFVEQLLARIENLDFDLSDHSGLENLKEFQLSVNNSAKGSPDWLLLRDGITIHDEHLMEIATPFCDKSNLDLCRNNFFRDLAIHSFHISYKTDRKSANYDYLGRTSDVFHCDITQLCKDYKNAIFFHLQAPHSEETMLRYMEMFG